MEIELINWKEKGQGIEAEKMKIEIQAATNNKKCTKDEQ